VDVSLTFVVQWLLGVPIAGSMTLRAPGSTPWRSQRSAFYTMGQFVLLATPVLLVLQLLSGAAAPMESMPIWLQHVMRIISPTAHFVAFSQAVLSRGADLAIVWLCSSQWRRSAASTSRWA